MTCVLACSPGAENGSRHATERFAGAGTATIDDETRVVLRGPPLERIPALRRQVVGPDARLTIDATLSPELDPLLAAADEVALAVVLNAGGEIVKLPPSRVRPLREGGVARLWFDVYAPTALSGATVDIFLSGYAVARSPNETESTRRVAIGAGSVLEVATGILEPAWDEGPVRFTVDACDGPDCSRLFSEVVDPSRPEARRWQDHRISLGRLAGRERTLCFTTAALRGGAARSLAVWGDPTLLEPRPRVPDDANVILLSIDTLRADHLSSYGYQHDTAPFIASALAARGTLFERCIAAAPSTTASHMTLFTSLYPATHHTRGIQRLAREIPTLTERLRAAGIDTGAVTEDGWLSIEHGFGRGFGSYVENRDPILAVGQVDATFAAARRWLAWHRDRPFFLFLHTYQVHHPFTPAPRYAGLFATHDGHEVNGASPRHEREMAQYDREIRQTDDALEDLLGALEALGLADRTVVVLTADHGEEFLEHGQMGHGANLFQEVERVPLIVRGPGIPAGKRIAIPVGLIDVMPTVLDLLRVPIPAHVEGKSLLPAIRGATGGEELRARPLYSESVATYAALEEGQVPVLPPAYTVQVGSRKLARYRTDDGFRFELYDLDADPGERVNLYPDRAADASDLRAEIERYESDCARRREEVAGAAPVGRTEPAPTDPEQREKLEALGYVTGD
ncbi:MAG: sulfatase [Acidobacteriota bacterium]